MFKCRRLILGAPELQDLYLGQNAMHTVRRGVARDLLLLPLHVGQLAQFSHLSVLELGGFICFSTNLRSEDPKVQRFPS
jgi:hypothetical protein